MTNLNGRLAADLDKSFPSFVEAMQGSVYNGARRWLPSRQDAEDATQEVFVKAYRALSGYSPEQIKGLNLRPWLFTITLNTCRNHARTRSRQPDQARFETATDPGEECTESSAIASVAIDEWRDRLARITAAQRDAIVLHHVVGMSFGEVGEVLGRSVGTVKSDAHRGLKRLRAMITSEESR